MSYPHVTITDVQTGTATDPRPHDWNKVKGLACCNKVIKCPKCGWEMCPVHKSTYPQMQSAEGRCWNCWTNGEFAL